MTLTRSFIRNAPTTPLDARLMNMAGIVSNADGSPRTGVLGGAATAIVTTTAGMTVNVAAAEFATSKGKADGVAIFTNDGTTAVTITAAPVSNSRIDVIWVKHNDDTTGDANALPVFGATAGTAAASPTKPAIPTGALELATLRIFAGTVATNGGSNVLTNTYQMTAARGGVVPFRTKVDLDLWTTAVDGQLAYVSADGNAFRFYTGATGGAAWIHDHGKPEIGTFTPTGIYSAGGGVPRALRQGGRVYLEGQIASSAASFAAATSYALGSIPAAFAPKALIGAVVEANGATAGELAVDAAGAITMRLFAQMPAAGTAALSLWLNASWPDKRLV